MRTHRIQQGAAIVPITVAAAASYLRLITKQAMPLPGRPAIPVSALSQGTSDQLYFALRSSLAVALTGGRHIPLLLDDPFSHADLERLERAAYLLRGLAERTQVVLFTCDTRYLQWLVPSLMLAAVPPARAGS